MVDVGYGILLLGLDSILGLSKERGHLCWHSYDLDWLMVWDRRHDIGINHMEFVMGQNRVI